MPKDVPLGAGYTGNVLLGAFPGQYRDTEEARPEAYNSVAQLPAGQPTYVVPPAGPDNGRPMQLRNIPGIGQVVVPVEHTMIGSVVPVDHTMVGMDSVVPVDHTMVGMGHHVREDLSGLSELGKVQHSAGLLAQVAGRAAHEALQHLRNRSFTAWGQVEQHVRARVERARAQIEQRLRQRLAKLAAVAEHAVKQALDAARPKAAHALRGLGQPEPGWARDFGGMYQTAPPSRGMLTREALQEQAGAGFANGHGVAASGDWYASMMGTAGLGEVQAWYSALNALQNRFIQMHAEIQAIGEDEWDQAVRGNTDVIEGRGWKPYSDFFFGNMAPYVLSITKGLLITKSHQPSDAEIGTARSQADGLRRLVDTVKGLLPQGPKATAEQAGAEMKARLDKITGLKSPEDAAKASLKEDLAAGGTSLARSIVIGGSIVAAALLLPKILGTGDIGDILAGIL